MPARRDPRNGRWRYRKMLRLPDGRSVNISGTPPINTKSAAEQAERDHIARLLLPKALRRKVAPTLNKWKEEFMATYVAANNKPSERISKESLFKHHLIPAFGRKRIDAITTRDIERFKARKLEEGKAPATVNNILTCLGKALNYALDCEVVEKVPRIKFMRVPDQPFDFLDFEEWERLVAAASADPETLPAILLAGDAGLRVGEVRALQWDDLDLGAGLITVQRTDFRGHLGSTKGNRHRSIPMTRRLLAALKAARHLRGPYVFSRSNGEMWNRGHAETPLRRAYRKAKLRRVKWHALRHTFCSHLAMKGAHVRTIQSLAGHASITTTMRYLHLTPRAEREAIGLLEGPHLQHGCNADWRGSES